MSLLIDFLLERISSLGVKHIFGVNGQYVSSLIEKISENKKISFIENSDETQSGFAADAYARVSGAGCILANYNTGALKLCNSIATAYTERSPVIVISGSPALKGRGEDFLFHKLIKGFDSQKKIFENITCYSAILDNQDKAGFIIDEALEFLSKNKQPIYLEIPQDLAEQPIRYDVYNYRTVNKNEYDQEELEEAIEEACSKIISAKNPVIFAGVQVARFNLGLKLTKFAEKHKIPIVTTLLSKSTIDENHECFAGIYSGLNNSSEPVKELINNSDCLLVFGEFLTDSILGFKSPKFEKKLTLFCSLEGLRIKNHNYGKISFQSFCESLFKINLNTKFDYYKKSEISKEFIVEGGNIRKERFFQKINSILNKNYAVITDADEYLWSASNLVTSHHSFLSPAFYGATGFAISGALGFQLNNPNIRPLVIIGYKSFNASCGEINALISQKVDPIIFILTNKNVLNSNNYETLNTEEDFKLIDNVLEKKKLSIMVVNLKGE